MIPALYADEWRVREIDCSENEKLCKKVEKIEKKVLTFFMKFDKIHKLTRAGHRRVSTEP